ncbi:ribosomal-protein-alanine acetyltransferase [Pelagivirga sediminicola]|uniref:Ribosomal-protein-alanine acetyltransferase n=1 Tax=Pelagivirga sediminicola TaxID=2170575 RepID=A0A2T7G4K8_9RHOB|nr:GNAT family N-acetyltransferase [Pelagivirga sediminicola]PVA09337.1 ribosomal-protein-alanine acetyltransferase [Pelagivirga sediminicola]
MSAADRLAGLHARAFAGQGRGWSADEFADLLASPLTCLHSAPNGFALSRLIADEAELLTLAVDPQQRRQGIAAALLAALEADLAARGAARQFLEVAADNTGARALYANAGYVETGRRAEYYARPGGDRVDALLMEKPLARG